MILTTQTIKKYCVPDKIIQVVYMIPGYTQPISRIGKIAEISMDGSILIMTPHGIPLITEAYGSDINGEIDIIDGNLICEFIILNTNEQYLKQIIKNNKEE